MTVHRARVVRASALLLAALSVVITACGAPPSDRTAANAGGEPTEAQQAYERFNAMSGQERNDALVAAARQEGALTVYGIPTASKPLAEAFQKKYGIPVEVATGTDDLLRRLQQEGLAGRPSSADVYESTAVNLVLADKMGLLGHFDSETRGQLPREARGENWTSSFTKDYTVVYNTNLVRPNELPDNVLGFAEPQWKGRLGLVTEDFDWYEAIHEYYQDKGMSTDEIDQAIAGIVRNSGSFAPRQSQQMELLEAGQFGVSVNNTVAATEVAQARGSSVAWRGQPTVLPLVRAFAASGLLRSARHPAAAMLYLDFALSEEGKALIREINYVPTNAGPQDPLEGIETVLVDAEEVAANIDDWSSRFDKLIRENQ